MLLKGVFLSFAAKEHELEGPRPGPDSLFVPHLKGYEIRQKSCPPQGARPFLHPFCGRLDKKDGVWRDATRRFCFVYPKAGDSPDHKGCAPGENEKQKLKKLRQHNLLSNTLRAQPTFR